MKNKKLTKRGSLKKILKFNILTLDVTEPSILTCSYLAFKREAANGAGGGRGKGVEGGAEVVNGRRSLKVA